MDVVYTFYIQHRTTISQIFSNLQPIINNFNILMLVTDFCKKESKKMPKNVEILIFNKFKSEYFVSGYRF